MSRTSQVLPALHFRQPSKRTWRRRLPRLVLSPCDPFPKPNPTRLSINQHPQLHQPRPRKPESPLFIPASRQPSLLPGVYIKVPVVRSFRLPPLRLRKKKKPRRNPSPQKTVPCPRTCQDNECACFWARHQSINHLDFCDFFAAGAIENNYDTPPSTFQQRSTRCARPRPHPA